MKISADASGAPEPEGSAVLVLNALEHPIKAVTVFSSKKAEVIRTFSVELEEGQNEVIITSLPSCIDTDSARLTGLGDALLFDVVCSAGPVTARVGPFGLPCVSSPALSALERARAVLCGEKTLRGHAADILVKYGHTMNAEKTSGEAVEAFIDSMLERGGRVLAEADELAARIDELDQAIQEERGRLEREKNRPPMTGAVTAVVMAKKSGSIELSLTYMVSSASWKPLYDLRAAMSGQPPKSITLHYRASIEQNTGEDWRNTSISVSTAQPGQWQVIPALRALSIKPAGFLNHSQPPKHTYFANANNVNRANMTFGSFGQPQARQQQTQAATSLFGAFARQETNNSEPDTGNAAHLYGVFAGQEPNNSETDTSNATGGTNETEAAEGWAETTTVVTESALSSTFHVEGSCSIPSGTSAHKVAIAVLKFNAQVGYVAVPRSAPCAFLQCEVKNTSEYRLLAGPVTVYLDNSPVSKSSIPCVNPDESFACTFGPDPSIRITYTRPPRTVSTTTSQYATETSLTTYKLYMRIQNTHPFPISGLVVRDAVPVPAASETQNSIKVLLRRPLGLGDAALGETVTVQGGEKDEEGDDEEKGKGKGKETARVRVRWRDAASHKLGKYEWLVDLPAGKDVKLDAEYAVRAPSDYKWVLIEEALADTVQT